MGCMPSEKSTVLIVDDEIEICSLLSQLLEDAGFATLKSHTSADALEKLKTEAVDLVLTDVRLPGLNGIDLMRKIKGVSANLPILLMSGYSDFGFTKAQDEGAAGFFAKPINYEALVDAVKQTLLAQNKTWHRKHERVFIGKSVEMVLRRYEGARATKIINIGVGGFFLALDADFPEVGENVHFLIDFDDGEAPFIGNGICRWTRLKADGDTPSGVGIEFVDLEDKPRERIIRLLAKQKTS